MKEKIVKVAAGELAYTTFTVTNLDSWGVDFTYSASDHQDAFNQFCYDLDLDTIVSALLHDCPYELYWFNKVHNEQANTGGAMVSGSVDDLSGGQYKISKVATQFRVVKDMQGVGYSEDAPVVDTSVASSAAASAGTFSLDADPADDRGL